MCLRDYSLQRVDAAQRLTRRPRRPRATSTQTSAWPRQNSCACAGSRAQTTVARLSVSPRIAVGGVDSSIPAVRTAERLASMGKLGVALTHTGRTKQREPHVVLHVVRYAVHREQRRGCALTIAKALSGRGTRGTQWVLSVRCRPRDEVHQRDDRLGRAQRITSAAVRHSGVAQTAAAYAHLQRLISWCVAMAAACGSWPRGTRALLLGRTSARLC